MHTDKNISTFLARCYYPVCVCVICVCVYLYIYIYIYIHTHTHTHTHTHACPFMHACFCPLYFRETFAYTHAYTGCHEFQEPIQKKPPCKRAICVLQKFQKIKVRSSAPRTKDGEKAHRKYSQMPQKVNQLCTLKIRLTPRHTHGPQHSLIA